MLPTAALRLQGTKIKKHPLVFTGLICIAITVLLFGNYHDKGHGHACLVQGMGYLAAMWLAPFVIDICVLWRTGETACSIAGPEAF